MYRVHLLLLCFFMGFHVCAQAPQLFRYQGRLVENNQLVNDTIPISFKLYDELSGGSLLYEDSASVEVIDGLYATYIGDDTVTGSISNALSAASLYLEITINGQTLSPREQLVSVPYALNAGSSAPSGSILLSTNYPDASLTSQGYAPLQSPTIDEVNDNPFPSTDFGPEFFFGDALFLKYEEDRVNEYGSEEIEIVQFAKTTDGISFDVYDVNSNALFLGDAVFCILNEQIIAVSEESLRNEMGNSSTTNFLTAISSDGETWIVQTNNIVGVELYELIVFKNQIYTIIEAWPTNKVIRSSNGIIWEDVQDINDTEGGYSEFALFASDQYLHFIQVLENTNISQRIYSPNGTWWADVPQGNLDFAPESDAILLHENTLWAIEEDGYYDYGSMETRYIRNAYLWKSTDEGVTWTEVLTLFEENDSDDTDPELYGTTGKLWISLESSGDLYSLSSEEELTREMNRPNNTAYFVGELPNGLTMIVEEEAGDDSILKFHTVGSAIKYSDGFYYYIKE